MTTKSLKILWIASAYGVYSETNPEYMHGGTVDYLRLMLTGLSKKGHTHLVLLPANSDCSYPNIVFEGTSQPTLAEESALVQVYPQTGSCLERMMKYAYDHQAEFDLIVNIGHDWLPHFMVGMFKTPYLSLPNLCNTAKQLDELIRERCIEYPAQVGFFSKAQRDILGNEGCEVVRQPFLTSDFPVATSAKEKLNKNSYLFWAGRILPEKGIYTALDFAKKINLPLKVAGVVDPVLNDLLKKSYEGTYQYLGLLNRQSLYVELSGAVALLQMQRSDWQEAFGRVTVEAMLCGCPVIYTRSGANQELIESCNGGVESIPNEPLKTLFKSISLNRRIIQEAAFNRYSTDAVAAEFEEIAFKLIAALAKN